MVERRKIHDVVFYDLFDEDYMVVKNGGGYRESLN